MPVETDQIASVAYPATAQGDAYTAVASLDARAYPNVSFTVIVTVQNLKWTVFGANLADFTDEVVVQAEATVASGAVGSFTATPAPFGYYRVKLKNASAGVVGTGKVQGYAK